MEKLTYFFAFPLIISIPDFLRFLKGKRVTGKKKEKQTKECRLLDWGSSGGVGREKKHSPHKLDFFLRLLCLIRSVYIIHQGV